MKSIILVGILAAAMVAGVFLTAAAPVAMLTYHNENMRQGANTNETILTPANVNVNHFGRMFSQEVDGYVYAQPLVMTNVAIPGKGVHNVVLVATEHDSVYAFDADSNAGADGGLFWRVNLGIAARTSPEFGNRYHREGNTDMVPEMGITGTPVIDPATDTIYVDVFTREVSGESVNYFHRLHALDIATGNERPHSPVPVLASVPGTGMGNVDGVVRFNARLHMQRPALTLAGGILYVSYGSHADTDPYHGWIIGFDPDTLQILTNYVFNTSPNASAETFGPHAGEAALWMGGGGLAVDANTNLYFETANGSFDANTGGSDYGDSFVRLSTVNGLKAVDFFTPYNEAQMQKEDADLGSGAPMLLPESVGSAAHPHLIVGAGKPGIIHLLDADNLGKYSPADDHQAVQELVGALEGGGSYGTPAYFNNHIFYTSKSGPVKAFGITNGVITPQPTSKSLTSFGPFTGSVTISANGGANGIVWVIDPGAVYSKGPSVLHAYNADNLGQELYNSSQKLARDNPGGAVKMTVPTVVNGKVYVGAEHRLSVYGVQTFLDPVVISPANGEFTNQVAVTLTATSPGASVYYTLDGSTPSANSTHYAGSFTLKQNALLQAIAVKPGAVDSPITSVSFVNTSAAGNGTGLQAEYYAETSGANPFSGEPSMTRTNEILVFHGDATTPEAGPGQGTVSAVRWTGSVQPQYSESYAFNVAASGDVRLYLNGRLIVDKRDDQTGMQMSSNTIALAAQQYYNLQLDFIPHDNHASVELDWSSLSTPAQAVPQSQLYPFTNAQPTVAVTAPSNTSTTTASASVTIRAVVGAAHNPIAQVSFYANQTLLGSIGQPPYTLTATGLPAGDYALTAVATDGSGLCSTSAPVGLKVAAGTGQPYGLETRGAAPAYFNMPATFNGTLPLLLSETGLFSNTPTMTPASGLVSYELNTPLWADGAVSTCYFAIPGGAGPATPREQIGFSSTGDWTFPAGTVFVKTLELNTDTRRPEIRRRLETQVLVRDATGQAYGVTYKWRADNSDADLLVTSLSENIDVTNEAGVSGQTWYYASPADCRMCHTTLANYVLGVNTRQLNGSHAYPASGVRDNQLRTLNRIGLLNPAFDETAIAGFEKLSSLTNLQASLEDRVRSYLDANCAQCHRPGGFGVFDARYETPLEKQYLVNVVAGFNLGFDHAHIITPKDLNRSVIYDRMNTLNPTIKMPLLGRNQVDTVAVEVLAAWINSLPPSPEIMVPVSQSAKTNGFE